MVHPTAKRALLNTIRALEGEPQFPLGVVPHLALLLAGRKEACRLVVSPSTASRIQSAPGNERLFFAIKPIFVRKVGDSWCDFSYAKPSNSANHNCDAVLLVIGRTDAICQAILRYELDGDGDSSGKALGYPSCCVAAYADLASNAASWPLHLLARTSGNKVSPWCNRLASLWGGCCPTGELFPCSLSCSKAIALGMSADEAIRTLGFGLIANEILRQSKEPLSLFGGEIVHGRPHNGHYEIVNIDA